MRVEEFIVILSENELANLEMGSSGIGLVDDSNLNRIIHNINSALTTIHRKYVLKVNTHTLETIPNVKDYSPVLINFIRFTKIYNESKNIILPINDNSLVNSVTAFGSGKVILPLEGTYKLSYQANHPMINRGNLTQELDIPDSLVNAVAYMTASLVYGSINSADNVATSARYLSMYKEEMQNSDMYDGVHSSKIDDNQKFTINGWI